MATSPMKSKPLHNFSLPCLKWIHKNQGNRLRKSAESVSNQPEYLNASPSCMEEEGSLRNRFSLSSCSTQKQDVFEDVHQVEESLERKWNLRSRKVVSKEAVEIGIGNVSKKGLVVVDDDYHMAGGGGANSVNAIAPPQQQQTENQPKSMRLRGLTAEGYGMDRRKEKRKFWIALSREEIEEDIYAMTGLRPSRRPKKRLKNVQKHLDNVFPGLCFVGLSSDAYRLNQSLR